MPDFGNENVADEYAGTGIGLVIDVVINRVLLLGEWSDSNTMVRFYGSVILLDLQKVGFGISLIRPQ